MRLKIGPCNTVTQATSKSTAVTCEGAGGQITMNNAALASNTSVGFTVNNSYVDANSMVDVGIGSGATAASYLVAVDAISAGSFKIHLRNITGGSLGEAVVINFYITKLAF